MKYQRIVILTGAGISAESGIRTFRGADGLWENHRLEDVATPEAFERDPKLVQRFYNERRRQLLSPEISPNAAHSVELNLERSSVGDAFTEHHYGPASDVVTQFVRELLAGGGDD